VLDQHWTRPDEEPEGDDKVAEHKPSFLDALKGLGAARKHMCQFDTKNNFTVMCNKLENEFYRPRAQGRKKHKIYRLVKEIV
jgi:hypothetical protein